MYFSNELKQLRKRCLLSQSDFAKELCVSYSTVNRWECGKAKPNLTAMKNLKKFCINNNLPYSNLEDAWLNYAIKK